MIRFEGLGKRYRNLLGREVVALRDFTLELRAGEVFGIAGPNGAGKSTLISLLLGYLGPTEGSVTIAGMDPRRFIESHGIGYLSELVNIPPAWRTRDALRRYALLAGVAPERVAARVAEVMATLGLEEHAGKRVRQLSKGNLQRLGLAQALLSEEQVIVLDEPTHGLDPLWTQRFRDVVDGLRRPGRLILIASHNLDELARLADRVAIMDRGELQRVVNVRDMNVVTEGAPYRLVVVRGAERLLEFFPAAQLAGDAEFEVAGMSLEDLNAALAAFTQGGGLVSALYPVHSALEQQFREAVGAGEPQGSA